MGKPRGTTLVRMMIALDDQLVRRFPRLRGGLDANTYPAATIAKHVKMARATMISFKSPMTLSRENPMTCKSSPYDE